MALRSSGLCPGRRRSASWKPADLAVQPATVRAAAQRLLARAQTATAPGNRAGLYADVTNQPSVVYGFDGMHYRGRTLGFSLDSEFHAPVAQRQLERCRWPLL